MSKPKGICTLIASSGRDVCLEWALSLPALTYPVGMHHFMNASKKDPNNPEFTRAAQREKLMESSEAVAEFSMWIDDDTILPSIAISELFFVMQQNPKIGVVGGVYCTKEASPSPIVFMELGAGPHWQWTLGDVFQCAGLGTGCMLIRNSILKDIPKPWFQDTSTPGYGEKKTINGVEVSITGSEGTDDLYFCQKVTDAGYEIVAHGGVLPTHYDSETHLFHALPKNSYPVTSYLEKKAAGLIK